MEQFTNLIGVTVGSNYTAGGTSLVLAGGYAALPTTGTFALQVDQEIFLCTARSGATVTVVPGSEGTTPANHTAGTTVIPGLTKRVIQQLKKDLSNFNFRVVSAPGSYTAEPGDFFWLNLSTVGGNVSITPDSTAEWEGVAGFGFKLIGAIGGHQLTINPITGFSLEDRMNIGTLLAANTPIVTNTLGDSLVLWSPDGENFYQ